MKAINLFNNFEKYQKQYKNYENFKKFGDNILDKYESKRENSTFFCIFIYSSTLIFFLSYWIYSFGIINIGQSFLFYMMAFFVFFLSNLHFYDMVEKYLKLKIMKNIKTKYSFINIFFTKNIIYSKKKQNVFFELINEKVEEYGLDNLENIKNLKSKYKADNFFQLVYNILQTIDKQEFLTISDDMLFNCIKNFNSEEQIKITEMIKIKLNSESKDIVNNNINAIKNLKIKNKSVIHI
jgi:hypothetical protein